MLENLVMLMVLATTVMYIVVMEDSKVEKDLLDKAIDCLISKIAAHFNKETARMKELKENIDLTMTRLALRHGIEYSDIFNTIVNTIVWELEEPILGREVSKVKTKYDEDYRLGFYRRCEDMVFLNKLYIDKAILEKDSISLLNEVLNTCCHELRHAWQHDNGWNFKNYISSEKNYVKYKWQRCEIDARLYASFFVNFKMTKERKEDLLEAILENIWSLI